MNYMIKLTKKRSWFLAGLHNFENLIFLESTVGDIEMLKFPISLDEIAQRFNDIVGVRANKGIKAQVQIADVSAKFDILNELPHF